MPRAFVAVLGFVVAAPPNGRRCPSHALDTSCARRTRPHSVLPQKIAGERAREGSYWSQIPRAALLSSLNASKRQQSSRNKRKPQHGGHGPRRRRGAAAAARARGAPRSDAGAASRAPAAAPQNSDPAPPVAPEQLLRPLPWARCLVMRARLLRRRLRHRLRCRLRVRLRLRRRHQRRCVCLASGAATIASASCVSRVATAIL